MSRGAKPACCKTLPKGAKGHQKYEAISTVVSGRQRAQSTCTTRGAKLYWCGAVGVFFGLGNLGPSLAMGQLGPRCGLRWTGSSTKSRAFLVPHGTLYQFQNSRKRPCSSTRRHSLKRRGVIVQTYGARPLHISISATITPRQAPNSIWAACHEGAVYMFSDTSLLCSSRGLELR